MKLFWVLAFAVLVLGCSSGPPVQMGLYNASETEMPFYQGVGFVKDINGSIFELESFNRTLDQHPQTKDTDAIRAFIEIEISWVHAKLSLDSGSNETDLCKSYEFLQAFVENATKTTELMENFMQKYPEFLNETNIDYETVAEINNNIDAIEGMVDGPEFDECWLTKAI